jgi:hypothetical protein
MYARSDRSAVADWFWTIDRWFLGAFFVLLGFGIVLSFAASPPVAERIGLPMFHFVERHDKGALLHALLDQHRADQPDGLSLVFSKTKHGARKLARQLNKAGFRADDIHGNKTQAARQKTLELRPPDGA